MNCDGVLNGEDEDVDGDGAMEEEDCDDTDPLSTIYLTDMDYDGVLDTLMNIDGDGIVGVMTVTIRWMTSYQKT